MKIKGTIFSLLVLFFSVSGAFGQGSATLTGIILDNSKAVIPGADITVRNEATADLRRTITNDEGYFAVSGLPSGTYTLIVEMQGFARWERTGIRLYAGDKIHVSDAVLTVATAVEQVTVTATPDIVFPVDSGEKSHVITEKQIQNLAIVGRSAVELFKILPGVVYTGEGQPGEVIQFNRGIGEYNVSGLRNNSVDIISDGANVIDPGCNCGSAVTPNVELVQEVKVQVANFSAENAKGPVVITTVSKAGTSEFHGEAYIYGRHNRFNSADWMTNRFKTDKPKDSFYFPGFNIGGPLTKGRDKLFFFAGFEWMRQNIDLGARPAIVATEKMRKGDFTELLPSGSLHKAFKPWDISDAPEGPGFKNAVLDPSRIDKGGSILMNLYPTPNRDPFTNNGFNYVSHLVVPQHRDQQLIRIDYSISDNTKLYTRFNHEGQDTVYPYTLWWNNGTDVPFPSPVHGNYNTYSLSTTLTNVLSPTTTNEVVFAYTDWRMPHTFEDPQKVSRKALGYPYKGIFKNESADYIPSVTNWNSGISDMIQPGGLIDPGVFGMKKLLSIEDNFSKVRSTHTMKFGFYYQWITNDEPTTNWDTGIVVPTRWGGDPAVYTNAFAELLMGRAGWYQESTKNPVGQFRKHTFEGYVQDNWKATRQFTLELGARFQHLGFMAEKNGFQCGFDAKLYNPTAPRSDYTGLVCPHRGSNVPRSIWKPPGFRASPRLGFAYDLTGRGRTIIRGGAGKFIEHGRHGDSFKSIGNPPLMQLAELGWNAGFLKDIDSVDPKKNVPIPTLNVLEPYVDRMPTTYSWSLTLSQRLVFDTVVEASYVGNTSSHQMSVGNNQDLNRVPEGAMFDFPKGTDVGPYRPLAQYSAIHMRSHNLSQNYHSLQLTANRQTGRLNFHGAYTFGKALGVGGASYGGARVDLYDARRRSYGPLPYDRTHIVSLAYNILLPDPTRRVVLREVLNGWQISGISQWQSGKPFVGEDINMQGTTTDPKGLWKKSAPKGIVGVDTTRITGTPWPHASRPKLTCDPRENVGKDQYVNVNCFAAPIPGENGHYMFPYLKHPGFQNHDLSIFKNFQLPDEDQKVQVRFSAYNFPNHPLPFFTGTDPGRILRFEDGKITDASLKEFGRTNFKRGRRLFQFAIKYMF